MNKQFLQNRIATLKSQLEAEEITVKQHMANMQAMDGALQECSHHLGEILKQEHEDSLVKAAKAEEEARVQAGVNKYVDDVSKLGEDS